MDIVRRKDMNTSCLKERSRLGFRTTRLHPSIEGLESRIVLSTFKVNTLLDTVAVDLKTGKDASGHISLRSAIQAANSGTLEPAGFPIDSRGSRRRGAAGTTQARTCAVYEWRHSDPADFGDSRFVRADEAGQGEDRPGQGRAN